MASLLTNVLNRFTSIMTKIICAYYELTHFVTNNIDHSLERYKREKTNNSIEDRIKEILSNHGSLYYVLDGSQPIVMIGDFNTAKAFYQLKEYKNIIRYYPYLGYVYEKTLKYCIGAHSGQDWLMMKKPLSKFFTTRSVQHNYDMMINKTEEWINETFSEKINEYTLQNLSLDKLTIAIMSSII